MPGSGCQLLLLLLVEWCVPGRVQGYSIAHFPSFELPFANPELPLPAGLRKLRKKEV